MYVTQTGDASRRVTDGWWIKLSFELCGADSDVNCTCETDHRAKRLRHDESWYIDKEMEREIEWERRERECGKERENQSSTCKQSGLSSTIGDRWCLESDIINQVHKINTTKSNLNMLGKCVPVDDREVLSSYVTHVEHIMPKDTKQMSYKYWASVQYNIWVMSLTNMFTMHNQWQLSILVFTEPCKLLLTMCGKVDLGSHWIIKTIPTDFCYLSLFVTDLATWSRYNRLMFTFKSIP